MRQQGEKAFNLWSKFSCQPDGSHLVDNLILIDGSGRGSPIAPNKTGEV